jgi:hypothetical protein
MYAKITTRRLAVLGASAPVLGVAACGVATTAGTGRGGAARAS